MKYLLPTLGILIVIALGFAVWYYPVNATAILLFLLLIERVTTGSPAKKE